ncbi:hypothetical protein DFH08DRAFT_29524 [Mycena albidolilacea]|uniref:Uncharacterized protein n=1 Tax=Mycena albidolilacea TaxID=1033008 RepID=A0AAD7AV17_9AGAR|nr:hypothetical protein DFH08DRAFT_29524 [Mycena albidolilacea]
MSVLFYLLEEDSHHKYSEAFTVASTWVDIGGEGTGDRNRVHCTPYTEVLGQIREGAIVALEATLNRYHHITSDDSQREYNLVGHRVEVVGVPYLRSVGFVHAAGDVGAAEDVDESALDAPVAGTSSPSSVEPLEPAHPESVPEDNSGTAEYYARLVIE